MAHFDENRFNIETIAINFEIINAFPQRQRMNTIGIFSTGEMGGVFGKNLIQNGYNVLTCVSGRSERTRSTALAIEIHLRDNVEDVIRDSEVIFSILPPENALDFAKVFSEAAIKTGKKPLYVDCNSISPATVQDIAIIVNRTGSCFVDAVFIGSADQFDTKTILYISGDEGKTLIQLLKASMKITYLGDTIGDASALKMSFGGFNKGLSALFIEIACASESSGYLDELITLFEEFYPETLNTLRRLLPSYLLHAKRRVYEIGELVKFLRQLGLNPAISYSVKSILQSFSEIIEEKHNDIGQDKNVTIENIIQFCVSKKMLSSNK